MISYQGLEARVPGQEEKVRKIEEGYRAGARRGAPGLGWYAYPSSLDGGLIQEVTDRARRIRNNFGRVFVLGVGGSYLGARAGISALVTGGGDLVFSGKSLSARDLAYDLEIYEPKRDHVIVISKSGTTAEVLLALGLFRAKAQEAGGLDPGSLTIISGKDTGLARQADKRGLAFFEVPATMGGRYSVLSPVGLLPLAVAGVDIKALIQGARDMEEDLNRTQDLANPAWAYGLDRRILDEEGLGIEVFCSHETCLGDLGLWHAQLFAESEAKNGRGIFPSPLTFSRDLHSLGQYIQEGPRNFFESLLIIEESGPDLALARGLMPDLPGQGDLSLNDLGHLAQGGVARAHRAGGAQVLRLGLSRLDAYNLGAFFYMMQRAAAISAGLLGVNPFDQPGVEVYKKEISQSLKNHLEGGR